jgi:outer membrane lipoprotein-sorting protein
LVKKKFAEVKDYEVDVKVKIDVDFLKVPDTEAKIYYKAPDKIQMKTGDNFALIPKDGLNFNPSNLLTGKYTSMYEGETKIVGKSHHIVKVIPMGNSSDIVLSTLWIDKTTNFITKVETTTKMNGTFQIDLVYPASAKLPLPSKMTFSFEVGKFNLPKGFGGKGKKKEPTGMKSPGKVYIDYKNYKVNKGLSDSIFKKKK